MPSSAPELASIHPIRWPTPRPVGPVPGPGEAIFSLEFEPQDRSVHHVRLMALSFVQLVIADHNYASRLTVCCAELVDSVARKLRIARCGLSLRIDPKDRTAHAELSVEADEKVLKTIEGAVEAANRGSPVEAYTSALCATTDEGEMVLGLARIRYEGQMGLRARRLGRKLIVEAASDAD